VAYTNTTDRHPDPGSVNGPPGVHRPGHDTPQTDLSATLAAIDRAVVGGCHKCGAPLDESPSADFCSEACQAGWLADRSAPVPVDGGQHPDRDRGEVPPTRSLGWLGRPPAGSGERHGHEVLDEVTAFVARFSVFPDQHCAPTLALWYAHTHAVDHFYVTPRLILDSAEPGSGKTRVLEVAQYLVAAPEMTINSTPAAIFRMVSAGPLTLLFDEVDAIFNGKNGGGNEDLRALLNAGYKRSATVARCVGDTRAMRVERFRVFAPAALAGIAGAMPATITTRAITIHMRKRAPDEHVDEFIEELVEREAEPLRTDLAAWLDRVGDQLTAARPAVPDGVTDRSAEIWRPLLAIADLAAGHWPDTARAACRYFVLNPGHQQPLSWGVRLLRDVREVFTRHHTDRLPTSVLVTELCALDEAPWGDLHGKPLNARRLADELRRYGVRSKDVKLPGATTAVKGYRIDGDGGLADAWRRYLPPSATAATAATAQVNGGGEPRPEPRPIRDPNRAPT
jgi:hypothetical protein